MGVAEWVSVAIGILGLAGIIFTALKFNRDDSTAVVTQQSQVVNDMHTLNSDLRTALAECRAEAERRAQRG